MPFTVGGNYGVLKVDSDSGLILERERWDDDGRTIIDDTFADDFAAFGNARCPYDDIARFDVAEWRRYYPGEEPAGVYVDIVDIGFWTRAGDYCAAEEDFRATLRETHEEAAREWSPIHAALAGAQGWGVFDNGEKVDIQRIDDMLIFYPNGDGAPIFVSDEDARIHVEGEAERGDQLAARALRHIETAVSRGAKRAA